MIKDLMKLVDAYASASGDHGIYGGVHWYREKTAARAAVVAALEGVSSVHTQEPVAWMRKDGNMIAADEKQTDYAYTACYTTPLYTAPQPPAELLATDEFYSWWEENPKLEKQQALIQFYNKRQPAEPLTGKELTKQTSAALAAASNRSYEVAKQVIEARTANAKRKPA